MSVSTVQAAASSNHPPRRDSGFGDFFRYHGWLSPGVRLFRQIGFPSKSLWISAAFLLPLVVLLTIVIGTEREQVEFARQERTGVQTMRKVLDLIDAAQARRIAAVLKTGDLTEHQARVKAAFDAVAHERAAYPGQAAFGKSLDDLKRHHDALMAKPAAETPDKTFAEHDEFVDGLVAFTRDVANASNLALDPDLDTYHLMNVSVLRGPAQYESLDMMRTIGVLTLQTKTLTDTRRDVLTKNLALWEFMDEEIESSYQTGIAGDAVAEKKFEMKAVDASAQAFVTALRQQTLDSEPTAGADMLMRAGEDAHQREKKLVRLVLEELDVRLQARIDRLHSAMTWQLGMAGTFVAIAAYLMLCFYRVMMGGLREVDGHLREISKGNLTTAPTPWGRDEAARLMTTMGEMQTSLRRIVGIVLDGSASVDTASQEIAAASRDLSARTEQAAANLEETSSTMEQISATVRQTSETVGDTKSVVDRNAVAAAHGGEVIREVVKTMDGIQASSKRIGEIIGVIDGIAFQTNILALNAAVEAARAGEQGRGFAVVASEVRALAGRSAEAAREIKSLITRSTEQVEAGSRVAADAGQTIVGLVESSQAIGQLIGSVASSAHEQSLGVGQVSEAVQHLDQATQQNAALVEQTAAAANALSEQARRLAKEVSFFRLK